MTSPSHDDLTSSPSAGALRRWLGLAVLCLPTAVLALDMSVLYLALPHIAAALDADAARQLWILDIYPLLIAAFLVPMGALGDRIGARRLLLIGALAFAAFSAAAAFAPDADALIAARALLGVAGACLMPPALALVNALFRDPYQRRTAIAVWTSAFMTGFATGPLIGGTLLAVSWWGAVFLLAVPVMAGTAVLGWLLLPRHRPERPGRFDPVSALLFCACVLPVVHGLKSLAHSGPEASALLAVGVGLVAGTAFIRRQTRLAEPLLDLGLLRDPAAAAALALLVVGPAVIGGVSLLVPQYLQLSRGLSAPAAGALVAPAALGLIVGALLAPPAARRFAAGTVIGAGLALGCAGLVAVGVGATAGPVWVIAGLVVVYMGSGPFDALGTDLVIGAAPPGKAASAGAAAETATELGTGLGIAALGTLGTVIYQSRIAVGFPDGVPAETGAAARESITSAHDVLSGLPPGQASAVREAAVAAFAAGMQGVALAGAALLAVLAVVSVRLLRHA